MPWWAWVTIGLAVWVLLIAVMLLWFAGATRWSDYDGP